MDTRDDCVLPASTIRPLDSIVIGLAKLAFDPVMFWVTTPPVPKLASR